MVTTDNRWRAERMAELTFELLENCQLKIQRTAEKLNLTVAEFKFFRAMRSEQLLPAGELSRRMALSSSRLTRIVDGLERKGLVRRDVDARDRRAMNVVLTPAGLEVQTNLRSIYLKSHQDIIDLLPEEATDSVIFAMEKLGEAMKEWIKY